MRAEARPEAEESTWPREGLPTGVTERFLDAGGVRFRLLSGGAGAGVPILFLHGWPTWAEVWLPVARRLGTRHPWVAPDLPSQHRSGPPPGRPRTIPVHAAAVRALLEELPFPRLAVVGNSMGGTIAVRLARERTDRVAALAVLDAAGLTERLPGRTARMYLPFLLPAMFRAPGPRSVRKLLVRSVFEDPARATDAWVGAMVADWSSPERRRDLVRTAFALRRPDASVSEMLPALRLPTLGLTGRGDVQFPWESAETAFRRVPGGRFSVVERAGHFPMVEQPQAVSDRLAEFLAPIPAGRAT